MFPKPKRKTDDQILEKVRSKGCCVCGAWPVDAAHIVTRGAGGPDAEWNVIPFCRKHHQEQHKLGFKRMAAKYPPLHFTLARLGWEWDGPKLRNPRMQVSPTGL